MKFRTFINLSSAVIAVWLLASCVSAKQMSYLMDMEYNTPADAMPAPELVIQKGDILSISVVSEDPMLSAPFNAVPDIESSGSSPYVRQYPVDKSGCIQFPVLGNIYVEGSTTDQIKERIASEISDNGYIKQPMVDVALGNFKITVIGNIGNKVLQVKDPSINILQVIAQSGGITTSSKIKDVMVIRTENGQRQAYCLNLQKKDLFESPVYYLKQDDVVYVKPYGSQFTTTGQMAMSIVSVLLSAGTLITNVILWTNR